MYMEFNISLHKNFTFMQTLTPRKVCKCTKKCGLLTTFNYAKFEWNDYVVGHHVWGGIEYKKCGKKINYELYKRDIDKKVGYCFNCNKETNFNKQQRRYNKYCSYKCQMNHNHPFKGKVRYDMIGNNYAKGLIGSMTGKHSWRYGKTKNTDIRIKNIALNQSGKNSYFYGKSPSHGKGQWYILKTGKKIWLRSSWELKVINHFEQNNIEFEYENYTFPIIYEYKNIQHEGTYTPDFYLSKENKYIEVKGWWRDDAKVKFETFKQTYSGINIKVWNYNKLKELGVL